ncbi:MAG TPA: hypothetical protein VFV38_17790 [Ktedonobacteraceae bacterium]|nr:hypothetical protein [Ktedonobacteraceae bacterium]
MNALHLYYSPELLQKLEKLAELTSYQRYTSFRFKLTVLDWCALVLASVGEQAAQLPLESPADLLPFLDALDQAGLTIARLLDDQFQTPGSGIEHVSTWSWEHINYALTGHYFERRARISRAGKAPLLARITAKLAQR